MVHDQISFLNHPPSAHKRYVKLKKKIVSARLAFLVRNFLRDEYMFLNPVSAMCVPRDDSFSVRRTCGTLLIASRPIGSHRSSAHAHFARAAQRRQHRSSCSVHGRTAQAGAPVITPAGHSPASGADHDSAAEALEKRLKASRDGHLADVDQTAVRLSGGTSRWLVSPRRGERPVAPHVAPSTAPSAPQLHLELAGSGSLRGLTAQLAERTAAARELERRLEGMTAFVEATQAEHRKLLVEVRSLRRDNADLRLAMELDARLSTRPQGAPPQGSSMQGSSTQGSVRKRGFG